MSNNYYVYSMLLTTIGAMESASSWFPSLPVLVVKNTINSTAK